MSDQPLQEELPKLEILCPRCAGRGGEIERRTWYNCRNCEGAGTLPTEAGKRILDLMTRHFRRIERKVRETE